MSGDGDDGDGGGDAAAVLAAWLAGRALSGKDLHRRGRAGWRLSPDGAFLLPPGHAGPGQRPRTLVVTDLRKAAARGLRPEHLDLAVPPGLGKGAEPIAITVLVGRWRARPEDVLALRAKGVDVLSLLSGPGAGDGRGARSQVGQIRRVLDAAGVPAAALRDGVPVSDPELLRLALGILADAQSAGVGVEGAVSWAAAGLLLRPDARRGALRAWRPPAGLSPQQARAWARQVGAWAGAGFAPAEARRLFALPAGHPDRPEPEAVALAAALLAGGGGLLARAG